MIVHTIHAAFSASAKMLSMAMIVFVRLDLLVSEQKKKRKRQESTLPPPSAPTPLISSTLCCNCDGITPFFVPKIAAWPEPRCCATFIYSLLIKQISIMLTHASLPTLSSDTPLTTSFAPLSSFPHH